jgi:hypothetical protein
VLDRVKVHGLMRGKRVLSSHALVIVVYPVCRARDMSNFMWFVILGCSVAAWAIGYGMGYRRGVRDAITVDIPNGDHRMNGE